MRNIISTKRVIRVSILHTLKPRPQAARPVIMTEKISRLAILSAALALSACATYNDDTRTLRALYGAGEYSAAETAAAAVKKSAGDGANALVADLELGKTQFAAGNADAAAATFEESNRLMEKFDDGGGASLAYEASALLTNQSKLPYTGYNYDRIMASAYSALSNIERGDKQRAAVALKRLSNYQQDAAAKNAKRIAENAKKLSQASDARTRSGVSAALANPQVSAALAQKYGNFNAFDAAKADYTNPFAHYLSGIFFLHNAEDQSDRENALASLRLAANALPAGALEADIREASDAARTAKPRPRTYVIVEEGSACRRNQFRLDIPLWAFDDRLPNVAVNFPYLVKIPYSGSVKVFAADAEVPLVKLADMDTIIEREFNAELPNVVAKTILSAVLKSSAQYAAARAAGDYGVLVNIAGSLYQGMLNDADLRTWSTLPKRILVASFPTPASRKIRVNNAEVGLSGESNIVFVSAPASGVRTTVRAFKL